MPFCPKCGMPISENSKFCPSCGEALAFPQTSTSSDNELIIHEAPSSATSQSRPSASVSNNPYENQPCPDTHMTKAIISLLVGGIFGIIAIIKANEVESLWYSRQYARAIQASKDANKWANISFIVGGAFIGIYVIIMIIYFIAVVAML